MYKFYYSVGNFVYCDVFYSDGREEKLFCRAFKTSVDAQNYADQYNDQHNKEV